MAHAQKPDFVFRRNGLVHLNRQWRQFSRLLAVELCASAVVMLDTPCYEVVWRVLATHCIRHFPLHFPFRASPCAITFQPNSTPFSAKHRSTMSALTVIRWNRIKIYSSNGAIEKAHNLCVLCIISSGPLYSFYRLCTRL